MKRKIGLFLAIIILFGTGTVVYAGYKAGTYYNGDVALTCSISCGYSEGVSTTRGAPYGKRQTARIYIYGSSGGSLGYNSVNMPYDFVAYASKSSTSTVYSAKSYHFVTDTYGNPEYPWYQQVELATTP